MTAGDPVGLVTLAATEVDWAVLVEELGRHEESAWVLAARLVEGGSPAGAVTLLIRSITPVPERAYRQRASTGLSITTDGWLPAFGTADADECIPVFVHTHPDAEPDSSRHDDRVDEVLAAVSNNRNHRAGYASLILGGTREKPVFSGRLTVDGTTWMPIDRLRVIGERLHVLRAWHERDSLDDRLLHVFDRQVRAFGADGQHLLARLRVGIVGAGGTGSAVAEQLIRLGVRELVVIDHQSLEDTNVTRVYGSRMADAGEPKVNLVSMNAERIGVSTLVEPIVRKLTEREAVEALVHCDVLFGCTDDHSGRALLTRFPTYFLQLLIDCAVVLDSRGGHLNGIFCRTCVQAPLDACLLCHGDVDPARLRDESLSPDELRVRQAEGYAPELDERDPSVVTFTTMAASFAINEMLARLIGYADAPNHLLIRAQDREISRQIRERVGKHWCGDRRRLAQGARSPLLGWDWPEPAR